MANHITVKFTSTDEEKFKEFFSEIAGSLGKDGKFRDGVYVEMVSKSDINQQIEDIEDAISSGGYNSETVEEVEDILRKSYL